MQVYGYIYETTNLVNGKKYIGQHKGDFDETYKGSGIVLKQAINKYGLENFSTEVLAYARNKEELDFLEKSYIQLSNALNSAEYYNIHEGGTGGNTKLGYSYDKYKKLVNKMSMSHKKIKNLKRTSWFDNKGKNNSMYGKHQSDFSKIKGMRTYIRNMKNHNRSFDKTFKDLVLTSADSEVLKKAFSRNNGINNPSSRTFKLTNVETGKITYLGSISLVVNYLGISYKQLKSIVKDGNGYYKPFNIKLIGKTSDLKNFSYISSYSIRRLDNIIRYNNRLKIHNQTVASHSYYVSYTMMRLLEIIDIPIDIKYKLLSYCLIHDISEIHIGDMPHDIKASKPEVKNMLEQFEEDFYAQAGLSDIYEVIKDDYQKIKYNLFKLCDLMDVFMYAKEELYLGNSTVEMSNILSQSIEDCCTIIKVLKFYKVIPDNFNFIKFLDEIYEVKVISKIDEEAYKYTTDEMEEGDKK